MPFICVMANPLPTVQLVPASLGTAEMEGELAPPGPLSLRPFIANE